ncbi:hypothetical protein DQ04_03631000, partial [Trypanosoma grayi]|uniref:hypothetical protein n=1 Tax=Trypanosoma grayi TaxID=71804 RepID=UPI0004F4B43C
MCCSTPVRETEDLRPHVGLLSLTFSVSLSQPVGQLRRAGVTLAVVDLLFQSLCSHASTPTCNEAPPNAFWAADTLCGCHAAGAAASGGGGGGGGGTHDKEKG